MSAIIEAYITNLGRYNEGHLDGEYLKLPATTEDVQALLNRIHVDGRQYEEIFITDYESPISGLTSHLGEHDSIDELNYLASLLDEMDTDGIAKFEAALAYGEHTSNIKGLINIAHNLDCYEFIPDISDNDDLGRYYIEELDTLAVPEHLTNYIDFEAYGRDMLLEDGGVFFNGGYVMDNRGSFVEHYSGREDIPEECCIFAYPKAERQPIRETLKEMQRLVDEAAATPLARPAVREER